MSESVLGTAAGHAFLRWLRSQVRQSSDVPNLPTSSEEVEPYRRQVRKCLAEALGPIPDYEPLNPIVHQTHERDGYIVQAVSFATFGGLRMTANAYIPNATGPVPAVLAVHGHSAHGRRDRREQQRQIGLVKSGYFVLAVDAVGSGERAAILPGSYHGGLEGAALWLTGYSLFAIQVHENYRAVDYLLSRPEVDGTRLAISGASGGGNQSLYSGAWDERLSVVGPVCSIGSYLYMVGSGNCVCETPFGLAGSLEQFDLLALIAPRALLVMNGLYEHSVSFWHEDAAQTIQKARHIWSLLNSSERVGFRTFPTRHGYWEPLQQEFLMWLNHWFLDETSRQTIKFAHFRSEDYDTLSCYESVSFPQVKTVPELFVETRGDLSQSTEFPTRDQVALVLGIDREKSSIHIERIERVAPRRVRSRTLSLNTPSGLIPPEPAELTFAVHIEGGLMLPVVAMWLGFERPSEKVLIWTGDGHEEAVRHASVSQALQRGYLVWALDLPGLGEAKLPLERDDRDWTATRACHMLGFTLAGLWIDMIRSIAVAARSEFGAREVVLSASGFSATALYMGAPFFDDIETVVIHRPLASVRSHDRFSGSVMSKMVPRLLSVGDVSEIASLRAPSKLTVVSPVLMNGEELTPEETRVLFQLSRSHYARCGSEEGLRVLGTDEAEHSEWF